MCQVRWRIRTEVMEVMNRMDAGSEAEDSALAYLKNAGLKLIHRNYRCRAGEIDLVMLDGKTLVLVEVRYRSSADYGGAAASVTYRKQRRIITAARHLLAVRADLRRYPARFDVIAISSFGRYDVQWIKGAFLA
jgi:putative endonuclease